MPTVQCFLAPLSTTANAKKDVNIKVRNAFEIMMTGDTLKKTPRKKVPLVRLRERGRRRRKIKILPGMKICIPR